MNRNRNINSSAQSGVLAINDNQNGPSDEHGPSGFSIGKAILLVTVLAAIGVGYWQFRDALSLDNIATKEAGLRRYQEDHPILIYGIAFSIYVGVTGLSLPGATGLTLIYGWYFGFLRGILIVSFASTAGATIAFLLSHYLFRDSIQRRFGDRLADFNNALAREGAFYLFTLRLIPAVPFFVINVVMGLTPIRTLTFWWVSQIGMLPGTAVYVYAGSSVPDLNALAEKGVRGILTTELLVAFVLLGIFPLAVKKIMQRISPTRIEETEKSEAANEETT